MYYYEAEQIYNEFEGRFKDIQKVQIWDYEIKQNIFYKARNSEKDFWNLPSEKKYP